VPRPARVIEDAAGERDEVGVPGADDRFRLLEGGDQADRDDGHVHRALDRAGERDLVARADGDLLARVEAAGRDVDRRAPALLKCAGELNGLLDIPPAFDPVGAGDAHGHGLVGGEDGAHGIEHFERKAHAVFKAAAIFVGALVRQR
jgi:hypothetical protein